MLIPNITGTYNLPADVRFRAINAQDVYLECNTFSGPVTINLPAISLFGEFLNIRVYITDTANNAANNPITINCNGADSINNNSNILITTNGGAGKCVILGFNQWAFMPTVTAQIEGVRKITVSATPPLNPHLDDIWIDIT